MKLSNGTEVIAKPYREDDVEEFVSLIHRNFREVNVKDYGERAMAALSATHDVNWFKSVAEYAHVYVFWNEDKIVGVGSYGGCVSTPRACCNCRVSYKKISLYFTTK